MKFLKNKIIAINILIFFVLPFFITMFLEAAGNKDVLGGFNMLCDRPYVFFCNLLIVSATISVGVVMGRFRNFWIIVSAIVWIGLGLVNYLLLCNRVLPFTAFDFQMIDAIPFIAQKYLNPYAMAIACLLVTFAVLTVFVLFFRVFNTEKKKYNTKLSVIFLLIISILTWGNIKYAIGAGALESRFPELSKSYLKNGFAYSFMVSLFDRGVERVEGYSEELIDNIVSEFEPTDKNNIKKPNVIFLQMESFFDLNALNCVEFSKDPVPVLSRLKKECGHGLLTVPVVGAGTVNTEFEIVTGMSVADFGAGEYPYKTILTESTAESVAYNLKPHGYVSHFIHDYRGTFYGRNIVYPNLGYDYFYSLEYMRGYETNINGWAKDEILIRYINESLDSTKGVDLINAVSVQGHGSYDISSGYDKHLTVKKCDIDSLKNSYEYYANQMYEMDEFVGKLIDSLSQRNEEVVLVIYGDHFPSLEIKDEHLNGRSIYQTDYVIWNNMGIDYESENLYAYQLNSKVLQSLGINDGVINSCHRVYRGKENYMFNLQALEYDTLYGEKYAYGGKTPYAASDMKYNQRKIVINSVKKKENTDNIYIIKGDGFSEKSIVRVGFGSVIPTYIDEQTLEIIYNNLDDNTTITVWETKLKQTGTYIFKK